MFIRTFISVSAALSLSALAVHPGKLTSITQTEGKNSFTLKTENNIELEVSFIADDVFRIQAAPDGKFKDPKNDPKKAQIIIKKSGAEFELDSNTNTKTKTEGNVVTISTKKLTLRINKADCTFTLLDAAGKVLFSETAPLDLDEKISTQALSTSIDEHYYGGGQQNGHFAHKGTKIEIRADGNWNEGGKPNPSPFYMSSNGYGVLRNTFSPGSYDFVSNEAILTSHKENRFDAYYFVAPADDSKGMKKLKRIVDLLTEYSGRPNFVPIWALELGEADAYMTRDKKTKELLKNEDGSYVETTPDCIPRLAMKYREHDMPGGWILPNDGYGCGYVKLPEVVRDLKKLGFYTGLWTESDLTKTEWEVGTAGIRAQKLDVAWTGPAYQFSLDANRQAWTSLNENSESRGFVWTVQGWAGTQRYSVCWTGDQYGSWDLIRYHIPTLIGSGLSGQAYATTDVDGIFGGSPETYTRDLQWKCFTPVLYAMNGWSGISKSPWAYEEPYRSINRDYLKLKMRMTPYMYKYTREAYDTGAPITRGMLWEFPEDERTWGKETQHQYMLGEHLLIAPVYTSMRVNQGWRKEDIYLPAGDEGKDIWFDYADGRTVLGNTTIDAYPVTLEKLPIFVKGGAIIPMYPEMLYNDQKPKDPLTFDLYPHGDSSFEMYEDDGLTKKFRDGEFSKQMITCTAPENKAGDIMISIGKSIGKFSGKLKTRVYQLRVRSQVKPSAIAISSNALTEITTRKAYEAATSGWFYDANERSGTIHIKLERRSTDEEAMVQIAIDSNLKLPPLRPYPIPEIRQELDKSEFLTKASSQQNSTPINNAFDGTPETHWHSSYGKKDAGAYPYTVDVDLKGLYPINGVVYQSRKVGSNGNVKDYEVYVSRSADEMGKVIAKGTFKHTAEPQTIRFPNVWGEHVRFVFLNSQNGASHAAASELDILRDIKAAPLKDEVVYLSDMKPSSSKGEFKNDTSFGGKPITVNEQVYKKGIGAKSDSEIIFKLDGSWDKLQGNVGMDDEVGDAGSVMFRVYADGKLIFESPEQTGKSIKQLMELDVKGVKQLKLILLPLDDGTENDHGDWVDAKLIRKGSE